MGAIRQTLILITLALLPAFGEAVYFRNKVSWQSRLSASEVVSVDQARSWNDNVMWVDARPADEFESDHIPGAILLNEDSWNELLPQLNVVAGLTNNALAGAVNPNAQGAFGLPVTADPFLIGGTGTVLSQIFRRNYPDYGIGFQLNIPLRNRVARADMARDELMLRQSEVRLKEVENQIRVEVENALVTLRRARASYDAAVETRQLQEEALDAEQQRLSVGQSTSFFVIQYERDLAQARSTEVIALGNYAKARAALDRTVGRTLDANNISLQEAEKGVITRAPSPIPSNMQ